MDTILYNFDATVTPSMRDALIRAFRAWEQSGRCKFIFDPSGTGPVNAAGRSLSIRVKRCPLPNQLAYTQTFAMGATIDIDPSRSWTFASNSLTRWLAKWSFPAPFNFNTVALHELGHVMGLEHNEPKIPGSIMNPLYEDQPFALSDGDLDSLPT